MLLASLFVLPQAAAEDPVKALRDELQRRHAAGDCGVVTTVKGAPSPCDGLEVSLIEPLSQFLDNGGTFEWLRLRYLPPRIEAFYPAEFAPGTPGDISDFTDALLPLIVPGLQQDLDARLALLDELLVSGEACGTGAWAQRKAVKKLWDKAGPLLDKAGDEADLRARYLLLLDVDLPDLATIEDMAPPGHFRSESSIAAKIPGR